MRRFFVPDIPEEGTVVVGGQEARHIARVLRMQPGEKAILFDGSGFDYVVELGEAGADTVRATVLGKQRSDREPEARVRVYQAVIKSDHFDFAVQKCTELGAEGFVPFLSERCVKRPKSEERFLERENRISAEAAKQCGRSHIPRVSPIVTFEELVRDVADRFTIFAYEKESRLTLKQLLRASNEREIAVVIGPEGGFTDREARRLSDAGANSVTLGKLILRAETAGAATLAMIGYEYGG